MPRIPTRFQQLTGLSSAQALTVPPGSKSVDLFAEGQTIRYRDDGVNPTATVGQLLVASTTAIVPFTYFGRLSSLRFIQTSPTATLDATFYKT